MKKILLLFILFLIFPGFIVAQDTASSDAAPQKIIGHPVILKGDTLFYIRAPLGAFTPAERARAVSGRLEEILRSPSFHVDSFSLTQVEHEYFINYLDRTIIVTGPRDTAGTNLGPEALAATVLQTIKTEMAGKRQTFNVWKTVKEIGYTLLVVAVLIGIIFFLNWLFRKIRAWVEKHKDRIFRSIKINQYEFLTVEREHSLAMGFLRILKIFLIVVSFLVALPVIFTIFPATEGITRKIIDMVWGPFRNILWSVINYIPELVTIIVIYIVFRYLIRGIRFLALEIERGALVLPGFHPEWAKPTYHIVRVLLYVFMFVVIFPYLPGSDSPVFQGVSVLLGVLISLGSTSLISNAMAGLVITYMRPYKIGDRIKIDDVVGDVIEKTMMITRIRTIKNEEVTIPNSKILTGYSVNYSIPAEEYGLIIHTTITIGYDAPWRQVHELLRNAAKKTSGIVPKPAPFVLQTSLDDFYVSYQINAYIRDAGKTLQIKSDLHQNIQDEFNAAGVEIMSPHYRAERDGSEITIPKGFRMEEKPGEERPKE